MRKFVSVFCILLFCLPVFSIGLDSLKTEHFEIIYPAESEQTANIIYASCEEVFERVSSWIGNIGEKIHLPVVIRSDVKNLNAYYTGYPYHSIVLYDTYDIRGSINYREKMLDIFEHELTHALLFNHKDRFWQVIDGIFCDAFTIQGLYVHPMFSEGLSVYSESRNGSGRLNDNSFFHKIKQAKIEDKFPSWFEAIGGADFGSLYGSAYPYGGAFVGYLAQTYGEEKLSEFYTKSSSFVFKTMPKMFEEVFGVEIEKAWDDFRISVPVPENPVRAEVFSDGGSYDCITVKDGRLYALDLAKSVIDIYDISNNCRLKTISSHGASNFGILPDGRFIAGVIGEKSDEVIVFSEDGNITRRYRNYYQGFGSGDSQGFVGNRGNNMFIDFYDNGQLSETIELGYACDVSCFGKFDDEHVSFILKQNGKTFLALLDIKNRKISVFDNPDNLKFLSLCGNVFSWTEYKMSCDMIRYGILKNENGRWNFELSEKDFFGGTWSPVLSDGRLFFIGNTYNTSKLYSVSEDDNLKTYEVSLRNFKPAEIKFSAAPKKHFNSLPYLFKGTIIPVATYSDDYIDLTGFGLTYITQDPYGRWTVNGSAGYTPDEYSVFGNLNLSQKLTGNFSLKENAKFRYQHKADFTTAEGDFSLCYDAVNSENCNFSVSAFANPFYFKDYYWSCGLRSSFSCSESKGTGPFEYVGFNFDTEGKYDIDNEKITWKSSCVFHIPRILKTGFRNNRVTCNLPTTLQFYYETDEELIAEVSAVPFALEIQNGWRPVGLFFNRLSTDIGWYGKYDIQKCSYENTVFTSVYLTITPAIGMGAGNVFGSLGLTFECTDFDEVSSKLSFTLLI